MAAPTARPARSPAKRRPGRPGGGGKPSESEHEILFQDYFKSVGPRTYAAQVKRATNGNHYLVLTEGSRDDKGEVRKTRLFLFSEDFVAFFRMVKSTAEFIKANPVPEAVRKKRAAFWAKQAKGTKGASPASSPSAAMALRPPAANVGPRATPPPPPRPATVPATPALVTSASRDARPAAAAAANRPPASSAGETAHQWAGVGA